jgi:hypothetical protein
MPLQLPLAITSSTYYWGQSALPVSVTRLPIQDTKSKRGGGAPPPVFWTAGLDCVGATRKRVGLTSTTLRRQSTQLPPKQVGRE